MLWWGQQWEGFLRSSEPCVVRLWKMCENHWVCWAHHIPQICYFSMRWCRTSSPRLDSSQHQIILVPNTGLKGWWVMCIPSKHIKTFFICRFFWSSLCLRSMKPILDWGFQGSFYNSPRQRSVSQTGDYNKSALRPVEPRDLRLVRAGTNQRNVNKQLKPGKKYLQNWIELRSRGFSSHDLNIKLKKKVYEEKEIWFLFLLFTQFWFLWIKSEKEQNLRCESKNSAL